MPRRFLAHCATPVEALWVVGGSGMVVAVTGVDREAAKFGDGGKRILRRSRHQRSQSGVDRSKVFETAPALDRLEKEIDGNVRAPAITVALEEVAPGARVAQATQRSSREVVFIGDTMAEIAGSGN